MSKDAFQDFLQEDGDGDVFKFPLPVNYQDRKYVSQHFGADPQAYKQWGAGHAGTDIAVPVGTPVYAARTGRVVSCRTDPDNPAKYLGLYVIVQSADDRYQDLYAHLSRVQVKNGASVAAGDRLGASGSTGNSTGPHLHFGERPLPKQANGYRGFVNAEHLLFGPLPEAQVPDSAGNADEALGPGAVSAKRRALSLHAPSAMLGAPVWIVLAYIVLQVMVQTGVNPGFSVSSLRQLEGVVQGVAAAEGVALPDLALPTVQATADTAASGAPAPCLATLPALDVFNIHVQVNGDVSGYGTETGREYCIAAVSTVDGNDWYELRRPNDQLEKGFVRAAADNGVESFESARVGTPAGT